MARRLDIFGAIVFTIPMTNFNRLKSSLNGHDMFAVVQGIEGRKFFKAGSTSGPVEPAFYDLGQLDKGEVVRLAYNYATNEYATSRGWYCTVIRINRKTVTVQAWTPELGTHGPTYRVEVIL